MARSVLSLCREFHCLPSALFAEDDFLLWCLEVEAMGRIDDEGGEEVI